MSSPRKGPGKRGHIVPDTLLPTQMFPRLPARATFVADTNFVSGTQKMSLIFFRNILCPQQMFPSLRSPRNIMGNNVSATMCPRLPGPYQFLWFMILKSPDLNNLCRFDFHGGENVNEINADYFYQKYFLLAFCNFFFVFSLLLVLFLLICLAIDFPGLPTFEGKRGLLTSLECSNS